MIAHRAREVGNQGDDGNAIRPQAADSLTDGWRINGNDGNARRPARTRLVQSRGECPCIESRNLHQAYAGALGARALHCRFDLGSKPAHERIVAGGNDEDQGIDAPLRQVGGGHVANVADLPDGGIDLRLGHGPDTRPAVQNPVDGGQADACRGCNIMNCGTHGSSGEDP